MEYHSNQFIAYSPFVLLSTYSKSGAPDCSPRGGSPGFVKVINKNCIVIPDSKGNNRLDTMLNVVETGKVGCLFLIPGVKETLRVNGKARITTQTEYLALFSGDKNPPKACIEISVKEVFLHCAKSLMRSKLWSPDSVIARDTLPTLGSMVNDQLGIKEVPESQEAMEARYQQDL
ncbi:MSMEG_1061 family FMN-dependent PPOX-type flavoprotein [Vreelandella populi]|uniref:MSMEG_1061 family FMN-dependent PPOX-type flavoprotein n=1 Tax=Vreelandella populi TaxID=2498858 RepID=UPI001F2E4B75|nr:MSMEG_1061 family FMN-dependent PPOX-type flavoprotein [Halomonas populi]